MSFFASQHLRHHVRALRLCCTAVVVGMLAWAAALAFGQDDDARFSGWTKLESATETRTYKDAMRGGGTFDAAARAFLDAIALPQLATDANRTTIERVRKRMREFLLADIANEKAADDASKAVMDFMESLAAKDDADAVVRVNAMLLIGELQTQDRKPWQPAAAVLARAAGNVELPQAVRIAACVGLARHVEAIKATDTDEQQRVASIAVPVISAILKKQSQVGGKDSVPAAVAAGNDWMVSRCLSMLPLLGPLTPATAAEVVGILNDGSRSITVRVRAAAALAAAAGTDSKVDKAAAIASIGALAVAALEQDVASADKLLLDRRYAGGTEQGMPGMGPPTGMAPPGGFGPPGMGVDMNGQPTVEQLIPREACRRAAWRLSVLADAVLSDDAKRGLARLGGDASPTAVELSQSLRRAAMDLDATPDETVLRQSLLSLKPAAPAGPESDPNAAATDQQAPPASAQ